MTLTDRERELIVMSLLATASNDVIYVYQSPDSSIESNEAINLAAKIRGDIPLSTTHNEAEEIRIVVRDNNEGVFEEHTADLIKLFPEIKTDIFTE